ncbi:MAG: hypothetical protein FWD38_01750 [Oscillospiraceae bacterium]|nr:hypothetical protein [Oscillospiraceae bacterium]
MKMRWSEIKDNPQELNGMWLRHTQTIPEIVYKGCVICWLHEDGDIEGVGTRITEMLKTREFSMLKKLVSIVDFSKESEEAEKKSLVQRGKEIIIELQDMFTGMEESPKIVLEGNWLDFNKLRSKMCTLEGLIEKYKTLNKY